MFSLCCASGVTVVGMDMVELAFPMAIRTKENTNSTKGMDVEFTNGMTGECTTACSVKIRDMEE